MSSGDLLAEKIVPQQFVSIVTMPTSVLLETDKEKQKKKQHKKKYCSLCKSEIATNKYYEYKDKYLHVHCYKILAGPFCYCCSQPLTKCNVINFLGKAYHEECFRCSLCQRNISSNEKVESYKGLPICYDCFAKRCDVCPVCKTIVEKEGEKILFEGQMFHLHKECAKCQECGDKLTQHNFGFHHGEVFCRHCWIKNSDYICKECGEAIIPNERILYKGYRHSNCFCCHFCKTRLVNSETVMFNNMLLCKRCADGIKDHCAVCFKKINGEEKVEMFGLVFHQKCYKCTKCNKILHNEDALFKKGNIICHKCSLRKVTFK